MRRLRSNTVGAWVLLGVVAIVMLVVVGLDAQPSGKRIEFGGARSAAALVDGEPEAVIRERVEYIPPESLFSQTAQNQRSNTAETKVRTSPPKIDDVVLVVLPRLGVKATVYPQAPKYTPQGVVFEPDKGLAGLWMGKGAVSPGEVGNSIVGGHVTDIFGHLSEMQVGDEVVFHTRSGITIHQKLYFVTDPDSPYHKEAVPWGKFTNIEAGDSVTHLITCGTPDQDVYEDGVYRGRSRYNFVVSARLTRIVWSEGGETYQYIPGAQL